MYEREFHAICFYALPDEELPKAGWARLKTRREGRGREAGGFGLEVTEVVPSFERTEPC